MTPYNLLFRAYTLCMSYVTNTFLLVSPSVRSKQLLRFVQGQRQQQQQQIHTTKNLSPIDYDLNRSAQRLLHLICFSCCRQCQLCCLVLLFQRMPNKSAHLRTQECEIPCTTGRITKAANRILYISSRLLPLL